MTTPCLGRVLIVDDELELMTALCDMLTLQGYEVVGHTSPQEALQALRGQNFDVLLSDLMMPEMDGITLLQTALALDPYLMGIVMTGQGTVQTAVAAMRVGAFDYLLKPFQFEALASVLTRAQKMRQLCMENVQLRETMAIYELGQAMAHTFDRQMILRKIVAGAMQQVNGDEASVMLPSPDGETLYIAAVEGEGREHLLGQHVPMARSISGWVASHGQPQQWESAVHDARFQPLHPRDNISSVSLPMLVHGKLVGVMNVNATHRRPFTLGQVKALTIFANLAAASLENAALYIDLAQAEEKYRSIVEYAIEGIFQTTPAGGFLTANPALARMLGYASAEALRTSITDIRRQLYVEATQRDEFVRRMAECGTVAGFEAQLYRRDGSMIWTSANARAVYDSRGRLHYYEGMIEDITEHKGLEAQLRQSQKMEAIGQLTGGLAHDFNNMLGVIVGNLDLLENTVGEHAVARKRIYTAQRAALRAADLTRRLLAVARRQHLDPAPTGVNALITELLEMLPRTLGPDIQIATQLAADVPPAQIDAAGLENALLNMAINARDAMPGGGTLTFATKLVELDAAYPPVKAGEIVAGTYVWIAVSDTGHGMSREVLAQVFEPFFTTKPRDKGTGLGLAMVYGFMKQSSGHIRIYSEPGHGTSMHLYVPVAEGAAPPVLDTIALQVTAPVRGTVLVVDDEVDLLEVAVAYLEEMGFTALSAVDGPSALAVAARTPALDLLLTDVVMPGGINGVALAQQIRQQHPNVTVIYASGFPSSALAERSQLQVDGPLVNKPYRKGELTAAVHQALARCHRPAIATIPA